MKHSAKTVTMSQLSPVLKDVIESGTDVCLTVTGDSMYPLFRNLADSVVLTKPINGKLKKYDIVLYQRDNGQYVLHRIIEIKNNVLSLNGDNQFFVETPIYPNQILAVVKGFYRGKRRYRNCTNLLYRFYSWFWLIAFPYRHFLIKVFNKLRRLKAKLKSIIN